MATFYVRLFCEVEADSWEEAVEIVDPGSVPGIVAVDNYEDE